MGAEVDPLFELFKAACLSDGASTTCPCSSPLSHLGPVTADSKEEARGCEAENLRITSESQWQTFANSLAAEGLVIELNEQQQLQRLWERAVAGANSFGRKGKPSVSMRDVHCCVDEMYRDDASREIDCKIANAQEAAKELQALLDTWNMDSFDHTQTRQALQVVGRLEACHRKSMDRLRKEQDWQREAFIRQSVLRLIGGPNQPHSGLPRSREDPSSSGRSLATDNPLVWQASNAGAVDQKAAKLRARSVRYPGVSDAFFKPSVHLGHVHGGVEDDPWGVSQGLAGSQSIICRRGFVGRPNCSEELPITVVIMPKVGTDYPARERLWRAFLAHRQLLLGGCVMRSLGFADRDPEETLFFFEHIRARRASAVLPRGGLQENDLLFRHWARGALVCLAQLSEQSTYTLEGRVSTANVMIGSQGRIVRLGGLRWGSEIQGVGRATEMAFQRRDTNLCLGLADTLEGLLGLQHFEDRGEDGEHTGEELDATENMKRDVRAGPSLVLVNLLAWLRLPQSSRQGITLKNLLGHQYFAPQCPESVENEVPAAWKSLMDRGKQ